MGVKSSLSFRFPSHSWLLVAAAAALLPAGCGELVVNVPSTAAAAAVAAAAGDGQQKLDPKDVLKQVIAGNSSTDTVTIEYTQADGTVVTQLTDFRMKSQIVRIIVLGEEELRQPQFQTFCFVSSFGSDLIAPEAVTKLRQKHPGTVRIAEQDQGDVVQDSDLRLIASPIRLAAVSSHLAAFCKDSPASIFTSQHELLSILETTNGPAAADVARKAAEDYDELARCSSLLNSSASPPASSSLCICSLTVCFQWYPCALKYCANKDREGEHRCGIKTCRKCLDFRFPAKSASMCSWDEV